jgi:hypothetical protein
MIIRELERGSRTYGLLQYLYGPGKANEHTNQHMVGAWNPAVKDPALSSEADLGHLAMLLDMPVHAMRAKKLDQHVWHGVIALADGDRQLTDAEWRQAATEAVEAAGLASPDDPGGCRWVAVRHADDHVHIVATLARQDGTRATSGNHMKNNFRRMSQKAAELEARYGLHAIARTAKEKQTKTPTRGEVEKAERNGRSETPRETLAARVRQVAAVSRSEEQFFTGLRQAGLRVNRREGPDGRTVGYSVALPGDRTARGRAIYYSGSKLGPDLSLPRVRERWSVPAPRQAPNPSAATRAETWQQAAEHVHQAAAVLGQSGQAAAAGELSALSDFLTTFATDAPTAVRAELRAAAVAFERAGRTAGSGARQLDSEASRHLRSATQLVVLGASALGSGGEAAASLALMVALALAVAAAIRWHQAHQMRGQEQAARGAALQLRAAVEITHGGGTSGQGRRGPMWQRTQLQPVGPELTAAYQSVVRSVLPQYADAIVGEAAWPALAATLRTTASAGYDPARILAQVARRRGFDDADSIAEVLVWRLQRRMEQDTQSGGIPAWLAPPATGAGDSGGEASTPLPQTPRLTSSQEVPRVPQPTMPPVVRGPRERPADPDLPMGTGEDAPRFAAVVHQAVPEHAAAILADPASYALSQRLAAAAQSGYAPAELLARVATARELDSADSVAEVLTWRVQGRVRQDEHANRQPGTGSHADTRPRTPAPTRTGEQSAAQRAAQQAAQRRNNPRGPGR